MVLFLFGLGLFSEAQKHLKSQKLSEHRSYPEYFVSEIS